MIKVKTFGEPLEIFKAQRELHELDERVNAFIRDHKITRVIGVNDTTTSEDGSTIGLVRVLIYEE